MQDVRSLLLAMLSPVQRRFILDPHRFKLARCTRRAGKTYAIAIYMILTCLSKARTPVLYAGLTRDSAKEAVWDILIQVLEELGIGYKASLSNLQILFDNGSKITVFGCDAQNARNRLRGRKFKLVCFDETGFFAALDPIVYAVLPMLADYGGTLCLTSSPGELLQGLFYEADQGKLRDKWSRYEWTIFDNPIFQLPPLDPESKFANRAEEELDLMLVNQFAGNPKHPGYRREWLGLWVDDNTTLVYPCTEKNWHDLYKFPAQEHAIGVSLGAFVNGLVVGRYSELRREFQLVETAAYDDIELDDFAHYITIALEKYKAQSVVVHLGPYSTDVTSELRRRYHLPITAVSAKDLPFYQKVFASDLAAGHIRLANNLPINSEYAKIVKGPDGAEIEGQPNYMANAALALYRRVYNTHLQTFEAPLTEEERHLKQLESSRDAEETPWFERYR